LEIQNVIQNRRIIKRFRKDPVDLTAVKEWLQLATLAPNHRMTEPWEVIFLGPNTRAKINHKTNFGQAPLAIAVLSKHGRLAVEKTENLVAVSCFIQNFMLLCWSKGVGTSWSSLGISDTVRNILQVADEYDVVGIIGIGYPEEIPLVKSRTPIEQKITYLE
jgi:nitroreductase